MPVCESFVGETIHESLGGDFYDTVAPADFEKCTLRYKDEVWAKRVGLGVFDEDEWLTYFGKFEPLPGSFTAPLALRYHGHQFHNYNPDIGDGRGFLYAQMRDLLDGRLLDFGTKGSGQTPWSRQGDGRLTLKGGVREILASKMLEARGVNTSKSFCLIETHEELWRSDEPSPTRSAVLTRLSHSHIRIGTFQRQAALGETANIARLLDHCITNYYPEIDTGTTAEKATAFLAAVSANVARTGARWMHAGFVHGVLNTDNININGESFDYGPWRFVGECDPKFTAAYFDHQGLYAFGRQADALLWNLTRLGECLTEFAPISGLEKVLEAFAQTYAKEFVAACIERLGLKSRGFESDNTLTRALWQFLEDSRAPFEQVFFDFYGSPESAVKHRPDQKADHYSGDTYKAFAEQFSQYEPFNESAREHAYFQVETPPTLLIDEVERIWDPIAVHDDWASFHDKLEAIDQARNATGLAPKFPNE